MAGAAHPEAMAPARKGATRTAPPQTPSTWWAAPRIRNYLLFGATGLVYIIEATLILKLTTKLAEGPEAWNRAMQSLSHPTYLVFHALTLAALIFVGLRAFGTMMPKMQPRTGPLPVLAVPVVKALVYGAWFVIAGGLAWVLAGGIF